MRQKRWQIPSIVESALDSMRRAFGEVSPRVRSASISFPEKANDLSARLLGLEGSNDSCRIAVGIILFEALSQERDEPDWAWLADSYIRILHLQQRFESQVAGIERDIAMLPREYSLVLIDMKFEFSHIDIGRTSWNEASYVDEADYEYEPRHITPRMYTYLDSLSRLDPVPALAETSPRFLRSNYLKINIEPSFWEHLAINPQEEWSDPKHDRMSFWISGFSPSFYHLYYRIENGRIDTTRWEEVDPDFYLGNIENLGMTVEVKARGEYSPEQLPYPVPPGFNYVGNSDHGQWIDGWWEFYLDVWAETMESLYGQYYEYSFYEWDTWDNQYRNRATFRGTNRTKPYYGSQSRFFRSSPTFRRFHINTTKVSALPKSLSLRGFGPKFRNRARLGRGGK